MTVNELFMLNLSKDEQIKKSSTQCARKKEKAPNCNKGKKAKKTMEKNDFQEIFM